MSAIKHATKSVNDLVMSFLFTGMPVSSKDADSPAVDAVVDAVRVIFDKHISGIRVAIQKHEESKDMEALTYDLLPVRNKLLYEAYAPYWLTHCRLVKNHHNERWFTYYNDLIDMYWAWKRQAWMSKDGCSTVMLPPTRGLITLAYQEAVKNFEKYNHSRAKQ